MYLNVELKLALVAIQNCLVLLHDYLGPNTKKLWLHTHTHTQTIVRPTNNLLLLEKVKRAVNLSSEYLCSDILYTSKKRSTYFWIFISTNKYGPVRWHYIIFTYVSCFKHLRGHINLRGTHKPLLNLTLHKTSMKIHNNVQKTWYGKIDLAHKY